MAKPEWLTIKPASTEKYAEIKESVRSEGLHTVCVEAHCPNISECWSGGTATFMVLGELCTRGCRFCAVAKNARGEEPEHLEPEKFPPSAPRRHSVDPTTNSRQGARPEKVHVAIA